MTPLQLEEGYWSAYRNFYRWSNILKGARTKPTLLGAARHVVYSAGWKKFEPLWNLLIRAKQVAQMRPALEAILQSFGTLNPKRVEEMHGALPELAEEAAPELIPIRPLS